MILGHRQDPVLTVFNQDKEGIFWSGQALLQHQAVLAGGKHLLDRRFRLGLIRRDYDPLATFQPVGFNHQGKAVLGYGR